MIASLFGIARPLLFALEPERAHEVTLRALACGLHPRQGRGDPAALGQTLWGLRFANPVGIAAGFDKNGRVPNAIIAMGCGFAEVGTVTPRPQPGNPRPRLFRLTDERAVINRLGFNNAGHAAVLAHLSGRAGADRERVPIVGVNIGANKASPDRVADYVSGVETFIDVASYFMINVSSPNTPGLRDLQAPGELTALLEQVLAKRAELVGEGRPWRAILVKLAPDIAEADLAAIVETLVGHGIDGICISNTTLARDGLGPGPGSREAGGLSGRPLFDRATRMLARVYLESGGRIPLIGVGGIDSGDRAVEKIAAGASLLQLYTGLIYEGPGLIQRIKAQIAQTLDDQGFGGITELVGSRAEAWAEG